MTADHDHNKYITTQKTNKLTTESFSARLAQASSGSKSNTTNFVKIHILMTN